MSADRLRTTARAVEGSGRPWARGAPAPLRPAATASLEMPWWLPVSPHFERGDDLNQQGY